MNNLNKQYSESIKEAYKKYEDNWLKENPPFAGPYTSPCLTVEEFINQIDENKTKENLQRI